MSAAGVALVGGALANKPRNGGAAWTRMSWVLALRELGFDVFFVEQLHSQSCVDDAGEACGAPRSMQAAFFRQTIAEFGLQSHSALIDERGESIAGLPADRITDVADAADFLLNISGHLAHEPLLRRVRRRAYLDLDPGYTQFWHAAGLSGARLAGHDVYFSVAENIGRPGCDIPTGGLHWRAARQPVLLDRWPPCPSPGLTKFTTIASWRGAFGRVQAPGKLYGQKSHEFRKLIDLPRRSGFLFELALEIHPGDQADADALRAGGWTLRSPAEVSASAADFRRYVQSSDAEFSVAQGIYVETHGGWFSDRTTRYLASAKPALVQETHFSQNLPVGNGLLAFSTLSDAVLGAEALARDYPAHCQAARALAESHFSPAATAGPVASQILEHQGARG